MVAAASIVPPCAVGVPAASPRRVLQLGMGWFNEEPGGLNRMYAGLVEALVAHGMHIEGIVAGDATRADAPRHIRFFAPRNASMIGRLRACRGVVRQRVAVAGIEVVAAHFAPYAAAVLDLVGSRPFVFHFHGPWAAESLAEGQRGARVVAKRAIEATVYHRADRFITLSRAFAELLSREFGVLRERIHVVPGGVNVRHFRPQASRGEGRDEFGIGSGRAVIGVVRRLVHRMGIESLIDAMVLVRAAVPEALLMIAGAGPLASRLPVRIASLGLQDHVKLVGFVSEARLPLFFRACDLSIVPSVALEGFGLAAIESLASGTPVLVTRVGGLPETVEDLEPALVLDDMSPAGIAAGIVEALHGRRPVPSEDDCARHAAERFDWAVIARQTAAVYG